MPTILTQLSTEPLTAERTWTVEEIPVLTASISLPTPAEGSERAARRIRRYYQLQSRSFLRYCERWLLPAAEAEYRAALASSAPLPSFRAELEYRVTYNENGLWSLYTQSRERGADGRTLLTRRGDTWDLTSGYPVPLAAFFPRRSGWKRKLLAAAEAEIRRREAAGAARWNENWRRELRRRFNPENFYLTGDGLAFFYPMYALAPASAGIPVFTVPYAGEGPISPGVNQGEKTPPA
ncbi:RsiV family protein [Dysosmobacter sp.]|uniref:RsiV family protein n=1 Tax=Dysosmobacter sp. TaxID=2591382 RepID=UPI003A94ECD3